MRRASPLLIGGVEGFGPFAKRNAHLDGLCGTGAMPHRPNLLCDLPLAHSHLDSGPPAAYCGRLVTA